jgi:ribonuclease HII
MTDTLLIAGVDEAGRGPLAGPVVAAAVILDPARPIAGLADSKKLSPARREQLAVEIRAKALAWALGRAEVAEIDRINILQASLLAMQRAVEPLCNIAPRIRSWWMATAVPTLACPCAKRLSRATPPCRRSAPLRFWPRSRGTRNCANCTTAIHSYDFARHKGYPTAAHREALRRYGPCPEHRRSFAPVAAALLFAS